VPPSEVRAVRSLMPLHWEPSVRPMKTVPATVGGVGGGDEGGLRGGVSRHGFIESSVPSDFTKCQCEVT